MALLLEVALVSVALVAELFRALELARAVLVVVAVATVALLVARVLLRALLVLLTVAPRVRGDFGCYCCCFSCCGHPRPRGSGARVGSLGLCPPRGSGGLCFWLLQPSFSLGRGKWQRLFFTLVARALYGDLQEPSPGRRDPRWGRHCQGWQCPSC